MNENQQRFMEALAKFREAAFELSLAWESEDVPDDVGAPDYPFQGDFTEVPLAVLEWETTVKKELENAGS